MNKIITSFVKYRGSSVSIDTLKDNSNIKIIVECSHGQRQVRWNRRNQLCRKCVAERGLYNTSKPGREITWGKKISKVKKGVRFSESHKKALSMAQYGVTEQDWPGFYLKGQVHQLRDSLEYREFRKSIMQRDNYACQITGMRGKLNVHHLDAISTSFEKALDPNNVITLHSSVHKLFHDLYGRGNNTKEQFSEFLIKIKEELIYG